MIVLYKVVLAFKSMDCEHAMYLQWRTFIYTIYIWSITVKTGNSYSETYSCARSTVCKILPHVFKQCGCDNFIRSIVNISKTVLTRVISIALTPFWGCLFAPNTKTRTISTLLISFLFPDRNNIINRDDDACETFAAERNTRRRSCLIGKASVTINDRSFSSLKDIQIRAREIFQNARVALFPAILEARVNFKSARTWI